MSQTESNALSAKPNQVLNGNGRLYRYTLRAQRGGSSKYGNCEVCNQPVEAMYSQSEEVQYDLNESSRSKFGYATGETGFTHAGCSVARWGHENCLQSIRHSHHIVTSESESRVCALNDQGELHEH